MDEHTVGEINWQEPTACQPYEEATAAVSHKQCPVGTRSIREGKPSGETPATMPSHALSVDTSIMWAQNVFLQEKLKSSPGQMTGTEMGQWTERRDTWPELFRWGDYLQCVWCPQQASPPCTDVLPSDAMVLGVSESTTVLFPSWLHPCAPKITFVQNVCLPPRHPDVSQKEILKNFAGFRSNSGICWSLYPQIPLSSRVE